jgi:hypothetical protein
MIVCRNCGHSNPDGTAWCQKPGCGAFLEFDGDPQTTQPVPTVAGSQPIGTPPTQPAPPTAPTSPAAAVNPVTGSPAHPTSSTGASRPMVRQVPPVSDSSAPARQPGTPAQQSAPVPVASVPDSGIPPIRPGDIVCPVCGWGNEPSRNFCRHDGAVLPRMGGSPPPGGVMKAGERPAGGSGGGGGRGILVALVVLAVVAVFAVVGGYFYLTNRHGEPTAGGGASATPTVAVTPVPSSVVSIEKVSSFATYNGIPRPPKTLLDGKASTFWSASFRDKNPSVRFGFSKSQTVVRIDIINGAAGKGFVDRPSAKDITLTFPDGREQTVHLEDQLGTVQSVPIDAPHAGKWVQLSVNSIYGRPHGSNDMYLRTSMADVAFFSAASPSPSPSP